MPVARGQLRACHEGQYSQLRRDNFPKQLKEKERVEDQVLETPEWNSGAGDSSPARFATPCYLQEA